MTELIYPSGGHYPETKEDFGVELWKKVDESTPEHMGGSVKNG